MINIFHTNIQSYCWNQQMTHHAFGKLNYGYSLLWKELMISYPYQSNRWIETQQEQIIY